MATTLSITFDRRISPTKRIAFLRGLATEVREARGNLFMSKKFDHPPQNIVISLLKAGKIKHGHFSTIGFRVEVSGIYTGTESWKLIALTGEKDEELELDVKNKTVEGISIKGTTIESAIDELKREIDKP